MGHQNNMCPPPSLDEAGLEPFLVSQIYVIAKILLAYFLGNTLSGLHILLAIRKYY